MKIIYAEDKTYRKDIIGDMIALLGHEVQVLSGAAELIGETFMHEYDIILIDININHNKGFEIAKIIKKNLKSLNTRLFIFAPYVSTDLKKKCIREGMDAIRQPLGIEDFRNIIGNPKNYPVFPVKSKEELHWVA